MSAESDAAVEGHGRVQAGSGMDAGKLVAGGLTVVSTTVAVVGSVTGAVPRFLRNHPNPLIIAILLSVIAVGVSLAGSQLAKAKTDANPIESQSASRMRKLSQKHRPTVRTFFAKYATFISFIIFSIAALLTFAYLAESIGSSDRPRITSTWTEVGMQSVLSVSVEISDMKVSDILNVSVRAVRITDAGDDLTVGPVVYLSQTGADAAGDGNLAFNVPLPSGYDALRIVANLGTASVTCNGTQALTPASPSPTPIASADVSVPVTTMPDNTVARIFSCVTTFAPGAAQSASPSPSPSPAASS